MKILVLGATGTVGRQVVERLLARGDRVRAMSRHPEKLAALGNVEASPGDLTQPDSLGPVFEGVDGVFLLNGLSMTETQEGLVALEWARRAGVRKLVYLSVLRVDDAPHIPHFGSKVAIEAGIRRSGLDYTILRPANFYQNDLALRDLVVGRGVYPQPLGAAGVSRVDVRDIADAAVAALAGQASAAIVPIVGPESFTGETTAAAYSRHLGRPVAYGGDDLNAWEQAMRQFLPPWLVFDLRLMYAHFQQHGLTATAEDRRATTTLIGHEPRTFDAFLSETIGQPA